MSFPDYKTIKKKFLFWEKSFKVRDGWKDVCSTFNADTGKLKVCNRCGETIRIAEEDGKRFMYCPNHLDREGGD